VAAGTAADGSRRCTPHLAYFRGVDEPATPPPPAVPGLTDLAVLARGGHATIYRAVQASVGRDVAVKVENRALADGLDQQRFLREARAAGRMSSHPHVVDLFDAGVTGDGHPYLIMEICDGSYADRIRSAPLAATEVREVGVKIADALADAHALGVLHRDVKPANILISYFGEPALADFGLAILAESRDASETLEVLTPAYAPREAFRPGMPPSPAGDVYSLAATLYALLRGRPPRWHGERDPSMLTLLELFDRPVPDLPGVPRNLLDVLRSGMRNEPGARPSAALLRDKLAALDAVTVVRPGTSPPALGPPAFPVPPLRPAQPGPPAPSRQPASSERSALHEQPTQPLPHRHLPEQSTGPEHAARRRWWPFAGAGTALVISCLLAGGAAGYSLAHRAAPQPRSSHPTAARTATRSAGAQAVPVASPDGLPATPVTGLPSR
jgi:serine/threonine protein kinase